MDTAADLYYQISFIILLYFNLIVTIYIKNIGYTYSKRGKVWVLVKNLRKIIVIGLVLGLLLASFVYYAVGLDKEAGKEKGKGSETGELKYEYIRFEGTVAEVSTNGEYFTILVERTDEEEPYDKMVFTLEEDGIPNVEVYKFDKDLISTDRILRIFPNEETEIVGLKGNTLTEKGIKNKVAIVFYEVADLSLPAQAAPKKVIVLD